MLHNDVTPVNEGDIQPLLKKLANILCLYHWRIKHKLEDDKQMQESLMKVIPNRDRNTATIYIRKSLVGHPTHEVGPLILHELMHLVLEPLVEEHTFQLQYEVSSERLTEYQKRFRRPLEKVVEHLTTHVSPLILLTEQIDVFETVKKVFSLEAELAAMREEIQDNNGMLQNIVKTLEHRTIQVKE